MKGKLIIGAMVVGLAVFWAAGVFAGKEFKNDIEMKDPAYPHTKGIVKLSHSKHVDEYKVTCGECHHDDKGKPLADLKKGADVKKCIECHKKPGQPDPKVSKDLTKEQKREFHATAMHDNCIQCHKDSNKKTGKKTAPETCNNCHPASK